jgi:DNA polymerase sigma
MSSRGERYASVAKGLILLLKILLANLNLNEPKDGGLASYGICVMVLVYLQHVDWSKISIDVKTLSGFLDFYSNGEFDYRHHIIRYDNRSDLFNINKKPVPNTNLVIIDPTDPTTNIGRSAYNYYSVYQGNSPLFYFSDLLAFKYVHEILQSCVNLKTHDCFSTLFYVDACSIELKSSLETLSVDETMMQPYPSYSQLSQLLKNTQRKVKAKDFKGPSEDKPKTSGKIKKKKKLKKAANKANKQKRLKQFQK